MSEKYTNFYINGVYLVKRDLWNNIIILENDQKVLTRLDYFQFQMSLMRIFEKEKADKILDRLNCGESVIIDFDKKIAKLIVDKPVDFTLPLREQLSAEFLEDLIANDYISELEDKLYDRVN